MRKTLLVFTAALALSAGGAAVVAQPVPAQPGQSDPSRVTAGTYAVEPSHTQILFAYNHMGFTENMGVLAMPGGTLTLDPKAPEKAKVSITLPVTNIRTGIAALDSHLMKPDMFDAEKFPTATFTSTSVKPDSDGKGAEISGLLTIKGIAKPVTLDASFVGAGKNPMSGKETVGFGATTTIKRSDFGLGAYVPVVGDAVELKIVAAFEK